LTIYSGEDECGCDDSQHTFNCLTPPDLSNFNLSVAQQCVPRRRFCDNVINCRDGSDEEAYKYAPHN